MRVKSEFKSRFLEFEKSLAEIHGLDKPGDQGTGETCTDIRHLEFQAMADAFLGKGYNPTKLEKVEKAQIALRKEQVRLNRSYETGGLNPAQYIDSLNNKVVATFSQCEKILGKCDFLRLFGAPPSELTGFIDRELFLKANKARVQEASLAEAPPPLREWCGSRANFVDRIASNSSITKKAAKLALDSVTAGVRDSLKKGEKVTLVGFGTFSVGRRAARSGRNPQTGDVIKIKAARVPRFRASKALKDIVR